MSSTLVSHPKINGANVRNGAAAVALGFARAP
jgi:hypothetical protein